MSRLSERVQDARRAAYPPGCNDAYERPVTRADCLPGGCNEARPCPWVSCAHHLSLCVHPRTGSLRIVHPGDDGEPDLTGETCALDVAEHGTAARDGGARQRGLVPLGYGTQTLEDVAWALNLTRERVRQIEVVALAKLRATLRDLGLDLEDLLPSPRGEHALPESPRSVPGARAALDHMRARDLVDLERAGWRPCGHDRAHWRPPVRCQAGPGPFGAGEAAIYARRQLAQGVTT